MVARKWMYYLLENPSIVSTPIRDRLVITRAKLLPLKYSVTPIRKTWLLVPIIHHKYKARRMRIRPWQCFPKRPCLKNTTRFQTTMSHNTWKPVFLQKFVLNLSVASAALIQLRHKCLISDVAKERLVKSFVEWASKILSVLIAAKASSNKLIIRKVISVLTESTLVNKMSRFLSLIRVSKTS